MSLKQAIIVRTDLKMGKGKIAAQCCHASVAALDKATASAFATWKFEGMKKIVLRVGGKKELFELYEKARRMLPAAIIKDAGLTQVEAGEPTCIAIGPADEADLDRLTGHLRLL
jgi:PTH2 family peptidyl-tRNA hydrolase